MKSGHLLGCCPVKIKADATAKKTCDTFIFSSLSLPLKNPSLKSPNALASNSGPGSGNLRSWEGIASGMRRGLGCDKTSWGWKWASQIRLSSPNLSPELNRMYTVFGGLDPLNDRGSGVETSARSRAFNHLSRNSALNSSTRSGSSSAGSTLAGPGLSQVWSLIWLFPVASISPCAWLIKLQSYKDTVRCVC